MEIITKNPQETQKLAEKIAKDVVLNKNQEKAAVIALEGDLGGGKTTFIQGFAHGLGIKDKILSPTFVLMKRFKIKNEKFSNFYHVDCYRISDSRDLLELGLEEIMDDPKNIALIEWADRIKDILPKEKIDIRFEWAGRDKRKITISGFKIYDL